jgi:hypothetical protein
MPCAEEEAHTQGMYDGDNIVHADANNISAHNSSQRRWTTSFMHGSYGDAGMMQGLGVATVRLCQACRGPSDKPLPCPPADDWTQTA